VDPKQIEVTELAPYLAPTHFARLKKQRVSNKHRSTSQQVVTERDRSCDIVVRAGRV